MMLINTITIGLALLCIAAIAEDDRHLQSITQTIADVEQELKTAIANQDAKNTARFESILKSLNVVNEKMRLQHLELDEPSSVGACKGYYDIPLGTKLISRKDSRRIGENKGRKWATYEEGEGIVIWDSAGRVGVDRVHAGAEYIVTNCELQSRNGKRYLTISVDPVNPGDGKIIDGLFSTTEQFRDAFESTFQATRAYAQVSEYPPPQSPTVIHVPPGYPVGPRYTLPNGVKLNYEGYYQPHDYRAHYNTYYGKWLR